MQNLKNSLVCFLLLLGLKFIWFLSMFMLRVSIVTSHSTSAMKTLNHRLLLLLVLLDDDIWILTKINHDFLVYQIYTAKIATQMAISAASLRTFLHINSEELGGTTSISVKNVLRSFFFTDFSTIPFALSSQLIYQHHLPYFLLHSMEIHVWDSTTREITHFNDRSLKRPLAD